MQIRYIISRAFRNSSLLSWVCFLLWLLVVGNSRPFWLDKIRANSVLRIIEARKILVENYLVRESHGLAIL